MLKGYAVWTEALLRYMWLQENCFVCYKKGSKGSFCVRPLHDFLFLCNSDWDF